SLYAPLNPTSSSRALIVRAKAYAEHLLPVMRDASRLYNEKIMPDAHLLAKDLGGGDAQAASVLLSILGSLALSITCVGVFGTVSYAATLRRKELGIRMALGAGRRSIVFTLVSQLK